MKNLIDVTVLSTKEINEEIDKTLYTIQKNALAEYKGISSEAAFLLGELSRLIKLTGKNPEDDDRYVIMTRILKFRYGLNYVPRGKEIKF